MPHSVALHPHRDLVKDMNGVDDGSHITPYQGFALAHNARSKEEVDSINLSGQVALVTGGGRGFGRAYAQYLAKAG